MSLAWCRKDDPIAKVHAKPCSGCGLVMEARWFYGNNRSTTGLTSSCMACDYLRALKRRERNKLRYIEPAAAAEKQCRTCEKSLPMSTSFGRSNSYEDGYYSDCNECRSKISAAFNAKRKARFGGQPPGPPPGDERRCSACEEVKLYSDFQRNWSTSGVLAVCKVCTSAAHQRWRRNRQASSASEP